MRSPTIDVCVLVHQPTSEILALVESVQPQLGSSDGVSVLLNGTDAAVPESVRGQASVFYQETNLGCPGGRNRIVQLTAGEVIVFLDDDSLLLDGSIEVIRQAFQDESVGAVSFAQAYTPALDRGRHRGPVGVEVGSFSGGAVAVRRGAFEDVGGYPSDFFLFREETVLALRLMESGWRIISRPDAVMLHAEIGSSQVARSQSNLYLRNELRSAYRCYPFPYWPTLPIARICRRLPALLRNGSLISGGWFARGGLGIRRPVSRSVMRKHLDSGVIEWTERSEYDASIR